VSNTQKFSGKVGSGYSTSESVVNDKGTKSKAKRQTRSKDASGSG